MTAAPSRVRMSAAERRADVLAAARAEFATGGYHATSTEAIAARAGISQPYLFRLFKTKKDLWLAVSEQCFERIRETFAAAAGDGGSVEERLERMGHAYTDVLLADRELLLLQMQLYASAGGDDEIQAVARRHYANLWRYVSELSGAGDEEVVAFFATGMLLNVMAALGVTAQGDESWAQRMLAYADA